VPGEGFPLERPKRARGALRAAGLLAIAALYYALPNARPDFTRFNSHDSESYLALAHSLTHDRGYTRSLPPAAYVPHEMWPPGTPLLLTPAVAGAELPLDWSRVKRTVATLGLLGLLPIWLYARRLAGGNPGAADAACLVVALNPFYWHFSHQAMAELPLFLALVTGLWWIDRVWSRPPVRPLAASSAGLLCGLGLLIKGHVAGLALAPLAYSTGSEVRRRRLGAWLLFCLGLAIPFGAWIARNQGVEAPGPDGYSQLEQLRLADPMDPASEPRAAGGVVGSMIGNLRSYAIYHLPSQIVPGLWPEEVFDWQGSGWVALPLTLLLLAAGYARRPQVRAAYLVLAFLGALNLLYGYGGSPRFWVPLSLLLVVLLTTRVHSLLSGVPGASRGLAGGLCVLALAANLAGYIAAHERHPYNPNGPWAELAGLIEASASQPLETAGVLTPNPHAFQLGSGHAAPMRVGEGSFDHMVARTDGVGPQPPEGSRMLLEVTPWALYELPHRMTGRELTAVPPRYPMEW
jgi:hypothetical protein